MLYGFPLCIINCSKTSEGMSEYNMNIFRAVNGKFKKHRYDNVLYIVYRNEYFVRKVSRLLYRICLFCI